MNALRPKTSEAIIDAAFQVLAQDPTASLSKIAERAGVGRATLHRYFSSRDELIRELALRGLQEMDEAVEAATKDASSYTEALRLTLGVLIPLGDRHGFLAREPLEDDLAIARRLESQNRELVEAVEHAKKEGAFNSNTPTSWIARVFDYLLYAAWESVRANESTHQQAADLAWQTLMNGTGVRAS